MPLFICLASAVALIGGALILYYFNKKHNNTSIIIYKPNMLEEIDALGPPKKDINGLLSFSYFKDIMEIVWKAGKEKFAKEKQDFLNKRRQLLQDNKMDEYKEVALEIVKREETNIQDFMIEVVDHIGLSEQEFMKVYQQYMTDPKTQQTLMQMQLIPQGGEQQPPKLTIEKTKEIFLYSEEKKMDQMKNMMESGKLGGMGGKGAPDSDPYEGMMDMMVEQCKLSDEIFFKYGVNDEELNLCIFQHNLMNDPEIQRTLMMNMQELGLNPSVM